MRRKPECTLRKLSVQGKRASFSGSDLRHDCKIQEQKQYKEYNNILKAVSVWSPDFSIY